MAGGELMAAEMAEQAAVLRRLGDRREEVLTRVREVVPDGHRPFVLVARGSSDNTSVFARYVLEHATRRPVVVSSPSLQTRYAMPTDYDGYVAVAISQSGRTPEIVTALERLRARGATALAITNGPDSPLAEVADLAVDVGAGPERAVPATKTVTAQLAAIALLAEAVGPVPWTTGAWDDLVADAAAALADAGAVALLAAQLTGDEELVVLARGYLFAAALETALKIKETSGVLAQGYSAAEFRHGPIGIVHPSFPVLTMSVPGPCHEDVLATADAVRERGGRALTVPGLDALAVPEALAVIPATIRGQQLAAALAAARGLDPDRPAGLSKVTATR